MKIKNASSQPAQIFYGLHFCPGVAQYDEPGKESYKIFLNESTIKKMDKTFQGKPLYVHHVDEVNLDKLQDADGFVIESFYNKSDGKHWAKFIVISDDAHKAIKNGWRLSNAYIPTSFAQGGLWNGVEYQKEVMDGEYEHLALVPNPRYDESIILTPEKFKEYNLQKETELLRIANSNGEKSMFKIFKKEKVENSADLEAMSVTLPSSKKDMTISECISLADKVINMNGYANGDHMVKVGEEEMSVNDLVSKHMGMCKNMADEEEKKKNADVAADADEKEKKEKESADKTENEKDEEKKENEEEDKKEVKNSHFDKLRNAPLKAIKKDEQYIYVDETAKGKNLYGSGK